MAGATIRDVAKQAGVGVGTVSRVLNNSTSVSESTRQKVMAAIKILDYSPSLLARRLSLGKTLTIGVILPFFTNPSYTERLRGILSVLSESEYDMILYNVEDIERRNAYFTTVPKREQVDGLLIITLTPDDQEVSRFVKANVPSVLIDSYHPELSRVIVDDFAGAYEATKHLIQLGHRKIGHIGDYLENKFNFRPVQERFLGYYQALEEADIPYRPEYQRQGPHSREDAQHMTHELLNLPDPPTAIFAYSDTQAYGVLEAARERQLQVPQELSVIGFDDIEVSSYLHLTTIRQPLFESGVAGGQLLLDMLRRENNKVQEIILPTELIVRKTTAPPMT